MSNVKSINKQGLTMAVFKQIKTLFFMFFVMGLLTACDSGTITGSKEVDDGGGDETVSVSRLTIQTDATSIKTDSSNSAAITVTALGGGNELVSGALIDFSADGGVLSAASVLTNDNGVATVTLSAGSDKTNKTITVSANASGASAVTVPVNLTGSTVEITASDTNLAVSGTSTVTITAKDAAGVGVYDTPVVTYFDAGGTGSATLDDPDGGNTNVNGQWVVDLTAQGGGDVILVAEALGAVASKTFTIDAGTDILEFVTPESGSTTAINSPTTLTINIPSGVTDVELVSSLGTFTNPSPAPASNTGSVVTWAGLAPGTITVDLTATAIGTATINVADSDNLQTNDTISLVFVDTLVDVNSSVSLQASPTTVAPSDSTSTNTSELIATVTNGDSDPIAGARVTFDLSNTTGSGEYVDPPIAYTDAAGKAYSTFYSGSASTDSSGVNVNAHLWDASMNEVDASTTSIIVGGTAGSIAIGLSTTVQIINEDTGYSLPVTVLVTDSGGNAMANTKVNLSLWPQKYGLGYWACEPEPGLVLTNVLANEDIDKDLHLDTGEDLSGDGTLTPGNTWAGTIPSEVTTDENGMATFHLEYLKESAGFIYDAITATALVQGTETRAVKRFWLPAAQSDVDGCWLGDSPMTDHWPEVTAIATSNTVAPNGNTTITVTLFDQLGQMMVGESVTASFMATGSEELVAPTIDGVATSTKAITATGVTFNYIAGDKEGTDWIKVAYLTPSGVEISDYVMITVANQ